jgi:hypothetical protein
MPCFHKMIICPMCGKGIDPYFYSIRAGKKICLDCRDGYDARVRLG